MTRQIRAYTACAVAAGVVVAAVSLLARAQEPQQARQPQTRQQRDLEAFLDFQARVFTEAERETFAEAERLAAQRDELGAKLNALLDDADASIHARLRAATLLGELQYAPAIPTLIRHRDVTPRIADIPPVTFALGQYGDAAVPQIVETFLNEELFVSPVGVSRGRHSFRLYGAIMVGNTFDTVLTYARGIAATEHDDAELARKLEYFISRLEARKRGEERDQRRRDQQRIAPGKHQPKEERGEPCRHGSRRGRSDL
jgi:hypothetical protein